MKVLLQTLLARSEGGGQKLEVIGAELFGDAERIHRCRPFDMFFPLAFMPASVPEYKVSTRCGGGSAWNGMIALSSTPRF